MSVSSQRLAHQPGPRVRAAAVVLLAVAAGFLGVSALAAATGADIPALTFHDGRFEPATLTVPANAPLTLRVTNASSEAIEFESFRLNRERVVSPGQSVIVRLPELSPGSYDFYDDFHRDVPEGVIVVK